MNLEHLRKDYQLDQLDRSDVYPDPYQQFEHWFEVARKAAIPEPNAMTLATASASGRPSARVVLLKSFDAQGFIFYTNYNSQKGAELAENPYAALVFSWLDLHRQVRIEGKVQKVDPEQSTAYFHERPKGSQIGAWASPQSEVIPDRSILDNRLKALEAEYKDDAELPRPEYWGGYLVQPTSFEFWQGRSNRLHDRFRYLPDNQGGWKIDRLAP